MNEDELIRILSKKGLRIIKYLYNNDYATLRMLEKALKINGVVAKAYMELMSKYGIIKVKRIGRAYVIMLNRESKTTKAILNFLREVGYL